MRAKGTVIETDGKTARVVSTRSSACSYCHNCENKGACHAELIFGEQTQQVETVAINLVDAKAGDVVELESSTKKTLGAAIMVFIFPILLAVAVYLCVSAFCSFAAVSAAAMLLTFILSFFVLSKIIGAFVSKSINTYIVKTVEESDK